MSPVKVITGTGPNVRLRRDGYSTLDQTKNFDLDIEEIGDLIIELQQVRNTIAKNKRVLAQRLLTEAEQLDPQP